MLPPRDFAGVLRLGGADERDWLAAFPGGACFDLGAVARLGSIFFLRLGGVLGAGLGFG